MRIMMGLLIGVLLIGVVSAGILLTTTSRTVEMDISSQMYLTTKSSIDTKPLEGIELKVDCYKEYCNYKAIKKGLPTIVGVIRICPYAKQCTELKLVEEEVNIQVQNKLKYYIYTSMNRKLTPQEKLNMGILEQ